MLTVQIQPIGFAEPTAVAIAPGVTILVGRNNVGKSRSLLEIFSIRDALNNGARPFRATSVTGDQEVELEWNGTYSALLRRTSGTVAEHWEAHPTPRLPAALTPKLRNVTPPPAANGSGRPSAMAQLGTYQQIAATLGRLIHIVPQRVISTGADTNPVAVPSPNGSDFARFIYTVRSQYDQKFLSYQSAISAIFPEIELIVAPATGQNQFTVQVHDKYARQRLSLAQYGTGVQQILHLVAVIMFNEPSIFLIDEPHVYLHPDAERELARVMRENPQHAYVVATHSPVLIDALEPDRMYALERSETGTTVQAVFGDAATLRGIYRQLGWKPSDLAWSDRVLCVEGESDEDVYQVWFDRWGWRKSARGCTVIGVMKQGHPHYTRQLIERLGREVQLRQMFYLDGDKHGQVTGDSVHFLPAVEIENVLLRDPAAVHAAFVESVGDEDVAREWSADRVSAFIADYLARGPETKGSQALSRLANEMGFRFDKTRHAARIAERMDMGLLDDVKLDLQAFVTNEGA